MSSENETIEKNFEIASQQNKQRLAAKQARSTESIDNPKRTVIGIGPNDGQEALLVLTHEQVIDLFDILYAYRQDILRKVDTEYGVETTTGMALCEYASSLYGIYNNMRQASRLMDESYEQTEDDDSN